MGFYEDDRIRQKNDKFDSGTAKRDEHRFKLELHEGVNVTRVVEVLAKAGLAVRLETNNRIIVKK